MLKYPLMRNNLPREDLNKVIELLQQDDPILTNGPNCREFEEEWNQWLGTKYSVFVNSGTSANLMSLAIMKMKHPEGGEIIVPPLTWISDVASVLHTGFEPVFVDINPHTLAMDTDQILAAITDRTRAVFLTHVQGFNGITDKLVDELEKRNIPLIEDVCESHGATHNRQRVGSIGYMSNFSFYYAHHMSTIEGGMVSTNDAEIYETLRMLRSHGMVREAAFQETKDRYEAENPELNPKFIFAFPAYNMRNTEIGGILGRAQLKRLDEVVVRRTENQRQFLSTINPDAYQTEFLEEGSSNYAFNLVLRNSDDELMARLCAALDENGVEYRRGSAGGGNQLRQPYMKAYFGKDRGTEFPVTDHIHFYGMYIGNFPDLSAAEVTEIVDIVNSAV
tara:strand:+ start:2824 stop:3999 length:1176 start_codon:yes stop_codon:yes gene_type:complete